VAYGEAAGFRFVTLDSLRMEAFTQQFELSCKLVFMLVIDSYAHVQLWCGVQARAKGGERKAVGRALEPRSSRTIDVWIVSIISQGCT
jgi:hypothetical protein